MPPLPFFLLLPFAAVAWLRPQAAVLLLLAALPTYLWRWSIFGIPTTWLELALYIATVAYLVRFGFAPWRNILSRKNMRWVAPAGAWVLAACLGVGLAEDKRLALGILKGWVFDPMLLCALVLIMAQRVENTKRLWQEAIFMLLLGAACTTLVGTAQALWQGELARIAAWYDSPNVFAMYLTPIAVAGIAWYLGEGRTDLLPRWKQVWLGLCAVSVVGIVLSGSYSALIALGLALSIYWLCRRKSGSSTAAYFTAAVVILFGIVVPWLAVARGTFPLPTRINPVSGVSSGEVRLILWREAGNLIRKNPVLGIGLGQWQRRFSALLAPGLVGAHSPAYLVELYYASLFPHNLWLATWLSLGLLGALALVAATWAVASATQHSALPTAVLSAILIHGIVDTPVFKNDLSILFWITLVAAAGASAITTYDRARG